VGVETSGFIPASAPGHLQEIRSTRGVFFLAVGVSELLAGTLGLTPLLPLRPYLLTMGWSRHPGEIEVKCSVI
jgi:hypothetical protein